MFGKMMNNYYYGKSGKGDFRKEDLPENRMQLFWDTLRTRLSGLCRINLLYMLIFLPTMIVILLSFTNFLSVSNNTLMILDNSYAAYVEKTTENGGEVTITEEQYNQIKNELLAYNISNYSAYVEKITENGGEVTISEDQFYQINRSEGPFERILYRMLLWLMPCLAITGPFTAGLSYVTRNWARDEHAFMWTDFWDAVKLNWKQSLVLSVITGILPIAVYMGWKVYGDMAGRSAIMVVPQALVVLIAIIWSISITYMHPIVVTYDLKLKDVIRNGILLGVARLPFSIGIRLLHCVPALIAAAVIYFWNPMIGALILFGYYILIGFGLSRFITASYTNAVFDRFINSRIEGAKVNQGLRNPEEDEDDGDDGDESAEGDATN